MTRWCKDPGLHQPHQNYLIEAEWFIEASEYLTIIESDGDFSSVGRQTIAFLLLEPVKTNYSLEPRERISVTFKSILQQSPIYMHRDFLE